jgi:hypothetical protein
VPSDKQRSTFGALSVSEPTSGRHSPACRDLRADRHNGIRCGANLRQPLLGMFSVAVPVLPVRR